MLSAFARDQCMTERAKMLSYPFHPVIFKGLRRFSVGSVELRLCFFKMAGDKEKISNSFKNRRETGTFPEEDVEIKDTRQQTLRRC